MKIEPIKRTNISDEVFEQLKTQLLLGEWKPGEKLPSENELAGAFGVSRVTIRNAIQKLGILGLVETRSGEGSFVREANMSSAMNPMIPAAYLKPNSVLDILDFRYVIEIETAGLAAERATEADVERLTANLQKMLTYRSDPWKFAQTDVEFHFLIAKATRNSLIVQTYNILRDILLACMKDTVQTLGIQVGVPYHRHLIEAFRKQDGEQARVIMKAHMVSTKEEFIKAMNLNPQRQAENEEHSPG